MTGGTLGTHADPDLSRATDAAARAMRAWLQDNGWGELRPEDSAIITLLAQAGTSAAWADLKRAVKHPAEDGRDDRAG